MAILINEAMLIERDRHINALAYERTDLRNGYSNGFKRLRTSNLAERVNREIKRRTRIASIFPSAESCERLVTAILIEISEEWESSTVYLSMDE